MRKQDLKGSGELFKSDIQGKWSASAQPFAQGELSECTANVRDKLSFSSCKEWGEKLTENSQGSEASDERATLQANLGKSETTRLHGHGLRHESERAYNQRSSDKRCQNSSFILMECTLDRTRRLTMNAGQEKVVGTRIYIDTQYLNLWLRLSV